MHSADGLCYGKMSVRQAVRLPVTNHDMLKRLNTSYM